MTPSRLPAVLLVAVLVVGCRGSQGPAGPPGPLDEWAITIETEETALPADGVATREIVARVELDDGLAVGRTVRFDVHDGGGTFTPWEAITDELGRARATYVAGDTPGRVRVVASVDAGPVRIADPLILNLDPPGIGSPLLPPDLLGFVTLSVHPDDGRIAVSGFSRSDPVLYTIDPDGTDRRYVGPYRDARWAPDGSARLLALDEDKEAIVLTPEGDVLAGPTDLIGYSEQVGWGPDAEHILVVIASATYVFDPDLESHELITTPRGLNDIEITAAGEILATGDGSYGLLLRIDLDQGTASAIDVPGAGSLFFTSVSAHPTGDWLVVGAEDVADDEGEDDSGVDLYLVRPDGSGLTPLLDTPFDEREARWMTSDNRLAFASNRRDRTTNLFLWEIPPGLLPAR